MACELNRERVGRTSPGGRDVSRPKSLGEPPGNLNS